MPDQMLNQQMGTNQASDGGFDFVDAGGAAVPDDDPSLAAWSLTEETSDPTVVSVEPLESNPAKRFYRTFRSGERPGTGVVGSATVTLTLSKDGEVHSRAIIAFNVVRAGEGSPVFTLSVPRDET